MTLAVIMTCINLFVIIPLLIFKGPILIIAIACAVIGVMLASMRSWTCIIPWIIGYAAVGLIAFIVTVSIAFIDYLYLVIYLNLNISNDR